MRKGKDLIMRIVRVASVTGSSGFTRPGWSGGARAGGLSLAAYLSCMEREGSRLGQIGLTWFAAGHFGVCLMAVIYICDRGDSW